MEAEVAESQPEFADVDEFAEQKCEVAGVEAEVAEPQLEFADVDEFAELETGVTEGETEVSEPQTEFADVDECAELETGVTESETEVTEGETEATEPQTEFADVDEFAEQECEVAGVEAEVAEPEPEFADVDEFAELETGVTEGETEVSEPQPEFADVDEFAEEAECTPSSPEVCDFKNLRTIFEYLPENGKDSFVSNRIRMVVEYVIAKTSGKRGLLKTAKMWRKSAHLDDYEIQTDEDKVTAREVYDLVVYLKTLANELENKEISKAICESADNVLQRIQL